jgi:hypothetical protein
MEAVSYASRRGRHPRHRFAMTPRPPRKPKPAELITSDGRRFKLKLPGVEPQPEPEATPETARPAPPPGEQRPRIDPDNAGA